MFSKLLIALCLILSPTILFAQQANEMKTTIITPKGTKFVGVWESGKVKLATKYGELDIDNEDIREIKVGYHVEKEMEVNIEKWIYNLGSNAVKQREESNKSLIKNYRFSYRPLKLTKNNDREISKRIEIILSEIEQEKDRNNFTSNFDIISMYNGNSFTGNIITENIVINSDEIGKIKLHLANVQSIFFQKTHVFTLKADEVVGKWFDTKITVFNQTTMTATGTIDLWPSSPMQYLSSPKGNPSSTGEDSNYRMGTLLGKIGENGSSFIIGESSIHNFDYQSGTLYVRVVAVPQSWGVSNPTGQYNLKIQ